MPGPLTALVLRVEFGFGRFPTTPVEVFNRQLQRLIETASVDAPGIRVRARLIEAPHAAMTAEQMLGSARPEAVTGECTATGEQLKPFMRDHDMQESRHAADRA